MQVQISLKLKKGIMKSDVSDHFTVFVSLCSLSKIHKEHQKIIIHKRVIHDTNLMAFKTVLHNDIDSNVIIKVCDEISHPLFMIFHSSFNEGIFPGQLKVSKVSLIFKAYSIKEIGNYRPISVLPISSKVLERIM